MVKKIQNHFKSSLAARRLQKLKSNKKGLKLVKFSSHRWLSLNESVERLLDLWEAIKDYADKYKDSSLKNMLTNETMIRLKTLRYLLIPFTKANQVA